MIQYSLKIDAVKPVIQSVNHVFAVDVSGSMYDSLPKMRSHIKSKLTLLVKPEDTVSIIYFSSKNQCGVVFEGQKITHLSELDSLHKAVDRFLQTLGLTGFVDPIKEGIEVVKRLKANPNGNTNSYIFMTDGYDNQWSRAEIIKNVKELPEYFDSISFLEYGWYCNRPLIAEMAQVCGASHVFSEDYKDYEPAIERLLQGKTVKRKPVAVSSDFAFYLDAQNVVLVDAVAGVVHIPEDVEELYTMDDTQAYKDYIAVMPENEKYIALYVAVKRMKTDLAWTILKSLGDVRLIKTYSNCFSKQEYSNMAELVLSCINSDDERFEMGVDFNLVPKEDAYTALDVLADLMAGENFLQTNHEKFSYSRIGAASVQKDVSAVRLEELKAEMSQTKDTAEIKRLAEEMTKLDSWMPEFTEIPSELGEPILNLVFNESRPNVSIQITKQGYIEIPADKQKSYNLPEQVPSHIFRNYTIIKDGILNMKVLPVTLDAATFDKFKAEGLLSGTYSDEVYELDLGAVPLINRKMVKSVSAEEFFKSRYKLEALKAKQKVFKHYLQELSPKQQHKLQETYGAEAAQWLESIGLKDYGFAPKVTSEKSGDFYYSRELNVKIAGLSSLPSVKAVLEKKAKGSKLNSADQLMIAAIAEYEEFTQSPMILKSAAKNTLIEEWLKEETKAVIKEVRELQYSLNKTIYSVVVGQAWFKEFASLDENELTFKVGSQEITAKAVLEEKEIAI